MLIFGFFVFVFRKTNMCMDTIIHTIPIANINFIVVYPILFYMKKNILTLQTFA